MSRNSRYSQERLDQIAKVRAKKNARRKARRAKNKSRNTGGK